MTQKRNEPIELYEPFESESAVIFFLCGELFGVKPSSAQRLLPPQHDPKYNKEKKSSIYEPQPESAV